ncbi:hypothetical protein GCM10009530_46480 [Microbispora corallina]|uniref:HTH marR-type domain-containing protein n=1 Tax=Microbispora corallina TaxID=83302 RepID=A0ABQ4FWH8_9ACTN|nr:MarR family transcriptional regulator [Microbispora corallina]GIH39093.1 hypothetical protein Mco01_20930 [Microbispora corallina]
MTRGPDPLARDDAGRSRGETSPNGEAPPNGETSPDAEAFTDGETSPDRETSLDREAFTDAEAFPDGEAERAARVWRSMRTLVLEAHDRRKDVSTSLGISFIRVKALTKLAPEPLTLRRLADQLGTDAPYTTLVVADLERRGLVERVPHPGDRRAKLVRLTEAGAASAERAERMLNEPPAPLLALGPADLAALDRIITALGGY